MPNVTITFIAAQQQINCNPDPVPVPFGSQTVTFNLVGQGAAFAATDGIYFKDLSPGTLTRDSDTQYTLTDNNANQSGSPVEYSYGINITYGGNSYSKDPEVENESGGGTRMHYLSA